MAATTGESMKETYILNCQSGQTITLIFMIESNRPILGVSPSKIAEVDIAEYDLWLDKVVIPDLLEKLEPEEIKLFCIAMAAYINKVSDESS